MTGHELERRRQWLCGQVALQRLELGIQVHALQARSAAPVTHKLLRAAKVALRWWEIGRLAWRLAAAMRSK